MSASTQPATRWDLLRRPQSSPAPEPERARSTRSAKPGSSRRGSKHAKPAVINSILDSFDAADSANGIGFGRPSSDSRPFSSAADDGRALSFRSIPRSYATPGFGVEPYGSVRPFAAADEEVATDAALAPSIPTSRPPSSTSHYSTRRALKSDAGGGNAPVRSMSTRSHRSALSAADRDRDGYLTNSRPTAESWVRSSRASFDSTDATQNRTPRMTLRRKGSRESLRAHSERVELSATDLDVQKQRPAMVPAPLPGPRGRLLLTDDGYSNDVQSITTPAAIMEEPTCAMLQAEPDQISEKTSARWSSRNSIVDSIPTRTSSLRQDRASSSSTKRREKKSRRPALTSNNSDSQVDSVFRSSKRPIPDSKWAGLGEDDETVKRIRELREKRQSRLMTTNGRVSTDDPSVLSARDEELVASELAGLDQPPRPAEKHKVDSQKAYQVLGLTEAHVTDDSNAFHLSGNSPRLAKRTTEDREQPANSMAPDLRTPDERIEMAVDEYLQSPRFRRRIRHPLSGRNIAFSEVGHPNGAAVFLCVGMGLTRYIAGFFDELAYTLRLRLITIDRPGVGGSEPFPPHDQSGPLNWPEDVLAVCESLEIDRFSILAHSAGSIYALATALVLPQMTVGKVHLLAPWIPPSQLTAASISSALPAPSLAALPRSQRLLRVLPAPFLKAANASFMSSTSASLRPASRRKVSAVRSGSTGGLEAPLPWTESRDTLVEPDVRGSGHHRRESLLHMDQFQPDMGADSFPIPTEDGHTSTGIAPARTDSAQLLVAAPQRNVGLSPQSIRSGSLADEKRRQKYSRRLTQRTWELATKDSNPATDLLVCLERHREIGFRYTDVLRDVVITHGADDRRVPAANVRWLAAQMNRRGSMVQLQSDRFGRHSSVASPAESCELRVLPGEGHGLMASPTVMGDVLTEIAGYFSNSGGRERFQ